MEENSKRKEKNDELNERLSLDERLNSFVFNTVLDGMKASVYITDPKTDQILYMNQTMREAFGLEAVEGLTCWKVLQEGMTERCSFCPVPELLEKKKNKEVPVLQWDEVNSVTKRVYQNYDSLIPWIDGRTVHLQQSVDITELRVANLDELTQVLTRRPGKKALKNVLLQAFQEKRNVTVCLYDINTLKSVNDYYGHAEGDHLIQSIAVAIKNVLQKGEFLFRLSGDEFVVVFYSKQNNAKKRMEEAAKILRNSNKRYEASFCYGLVETSINHPISVDEVLFLADERMYEQKRDFHILRTEQVLLLNGQRHVTEAFDYDKERLYDALVKSTDSYLYVCNMKTGGFRYPKAMVEEFDLPSEVIFNAAAVWGAKVHKDDRPAFLAANQEITDGRATSHFVEYRAKNRLGEWVWVRCRGHLELDEKGEPSIFAGFITNLGKRNNVDHLTGLYNKLEMEGMMNHLIQSDTPFALMVLGIDDLKHINDLYDRTFGDEVIRIIAHRIQSYLPHNATIYRLDGDEFGVLIQGADLVAAKSIYSAIFHTFKNQQAYADKKYYSTLSGGCVFYPRDGANYLDLIKYADYSLEIAKSQGKKHCVYFTPEILKLRSRKLAMIEELRASVENNCEGFSLCYQPLVAAETGEILGAEALARWQSESFGAVSPVEFIPLLEQTGLIVPVGKWVLQEAIKTGKPWLEKYPDFLLDINLSYFQIQEANFLPFMEEVMASGVFPPYNLVMELTETYFAQENEAVQKVFNALRGMDIRVAMDDFGTGYSTLGLLKDYPADIVKIDKTFVRDIQKNSFDATFIYFVVSLCHDAGIQVCLEGVETTEEYDIVSTLGLDFIQGYLFDKPMTAEAFHKKHML